jgi:CTP synthase (UTP-ammonia lyase)
MKTPLRLALVGDYHPDIVAHQAIPLAIDDAAAVLEQPVKYDWLATPSIVSGEALAEYDAVWVVPGSPYRHPQGLYCDPLCPRKRHPFPRHLRRLSARGD